MNPWVQRRISGRGREPGGVVRALSRGHVIGHRIGTPAPEFQALERKGLGPSKPL